VSFVLRCVALRCFCSRLFACKAVPTEPAAQQQGACQCDFTFSLSTSVRPPFPSFCLATTLTFSKRLVKAKKGRKRCVCDRVCQQNKTQKRVSDGMMGEAQEKNEQSKKQKELMPVTSLSIVTISPTRLGCGGCARMSECVCVCQEATALQ
jgi:hypothetical protein